MIRKSSALLAMAATALLAASLVIGCGGGAATPAATSVPQPAAAAKPAAPEPTKAPAAEAAKPAAPTQAPAAAPTKAPVVEAAKGFYEGKTINVILPNSAGQGNDTTIRYTTPYVKKYANAKDVLVENAVGAAGLKGFNQIYVAKGDGLTLGSGSLMSMLLQQLSEQEGRQFDANKFQYLGRVYTEQRVLIVPAKSPIKSVEDVLKLGRPVVMPIQGPDEDFLSMALVNKLLGIPTKVITGYAGQADVFLAVLRGEGDWAGTGIRSAQPLIKQGDMRPIMVIGSQRHKDYPDVPTAAEVVKSAEAKPLIDAVNNVVDLNLNYWAPPSVDPKVVAEARSIFGKALTDQEAVSQAQAKIGGRSISYMSGEDVQKRVAQVLAEGGKLTPILKEALAALK